MTTIHYAYLEGTGTLHADGGLLFNMGPAVVARPIKVTGDTVVRSYVRFEPNTFAIKPASRLILDGGLMSGPIVNDGLFLALSGTFGRLESKESWLQNNGTIRAEGFLKFADGTLLPNGGTLSLGPNARVQLDGPFENLPEGVLSFDLSPTSTALLNVSGNGSLDGELQIHRVGFDPAVGSTFTLIDFGAFTYTGTFASRSAGWDVVYGAHSISVVRTEAVPEPASLIPLALGAAALMRRRASRAK